MRILDFTVHYGEEFVRILQDAATPPNDREDVQRALQELYDADDPRWLLQDLREVNGLLEFVIEAPASGHRYGVIFLDLDHVADAIAYWRLPPLYEVADHPLPHGHSRDHAIELAKQRKRKAVHGQGT